MPAHQEGAPEIGTGRVEPAGHPNQKTLPLVHAPPKSSARLTCIFLAAKKMAPHATTSALNRTHNVVRRLREHKMVKILVSRLDSNIQAGQTSYLEYSKPIPTCRSVCSKPAV